MKIFADVIEGIVFAVLWAIFVTPILFVGFSHALSNGNLWIGIMLCLGLLIATLVGVLGNSRIRPLGISDGTFIVTAMIYFAAALVILYTRM